jgi:hypothetical protein
MRDELAVQSEAFEFDTEFEQLGAAEQSAQQVEDGYSGTGRPTPGILPVIRSISANVHSADNEASLRVISFHRRARPAWSSHHGGLTASPAGLPPLSAPRKRKR